MTAQDYDLAIKQAYTELEAAQSRASLFLHQFETVVAQYVSTWAKDLVEKAVIQNPGVTKSLGKERIAEMKKKFHAIEQTTPNDVQSRLSSNDLWPHRNDIPPAALSNYMMLAFELTEKRNKTLDEVIRDLIGQVGALLIENGYANTDSRSEWETRTNKPPRYRYGLPSHEIPQANELGKLNKQYGKALEEYVSAAKKLNDAKKAKESHEAKNLWDEA